MADTSSSVKVMRAMVEAPHSCNSGSAVVLRGKRLQTSVSSYAAAGISGVWQQAHAAYLGSRPLPTIAKQLSKGQRQDQTHTVAA